MTPCLLTLGAIPATSADTPHYPGDTTAEGGLSGGAAKHSVVNTDTGCRPALLQHRCTNDGCGGDGGHISPTQIFYFRRGDVSDNEAGGSFSNSLSLSTPSRPELRAHGHASRFGHSTGFGADRWGHENM